MNNFWKNFIKNEKIKNDVMWTIEYKTDFIVMTSNIEFSKIPSISDLINFYNIEYKNDKFYIDYNDIYDLYYDENGQESSIYKKFNLPDIFKGQLSIANKNNFIQDEEVFYNYEFKDLNEYYIIKNKNILVSQLTNKYKLLPKKIYSLIEQINDYNVSKDNRASLVNQFDMLKLIKDYAENTNITLSKRLNDERTPVIFDGQLKIDFTDDGEVLELQPIFLDNEVDNEKLLREIYKNNKLKDVYTIESNGNKYKFILKNKKPIKTLIENKINTKEKRLDILSGKSEIFNDDDFDISLFGPRVIGIGYLSYRPFGTERNSSDLDWLEKECTFPQVAGIDRNGETKTFKIEPRHLPFLEEKLKEATDLNEDIEVEFSDDYGNKFKLIMNKDDIQHEINKLKSSIIHPEQIKSMKFLGYVS